MAEKTNTEQPENDAPPVICLRNYPESLFNVISTKKAEMIKKSKRHVSYEMVVITMLKENLKNES